MPEQPGNSNVLQLLLTEEEPRQALSSAPPMHYSSESGRELRQLLLRFRGCRRDFAPLGLKPDIYAVLFSSQYPAHGHNRLLEAEAEEFAETTSLLDAAKLAQHRCL